MLKIVKDTNPNLRGRCLEVTLPLEKKNKDLLDEMLAYLKNSQDPAWKEKHPSVREGVGLAAPQVGHNLRMLVIYYPNGDEENAITQYELVNPKIVVNSVKKAYLEAGEGCLSVDSEHPGYVYRDFKIVVAAYEAISGKDVHITARGFDAIVLQHEIDHLDGVLFYDHINKKDPYQKLPNSISI